MDHGRPAWLLVNAGRLRRREVYIRVGEVRATDQGLQLACDREEALGSASGEQAGRLKRWSETGEDAALAG